MICTVRFVLFFSVFLLASYKCFSDERIANVTNAWNARTKQLAQFQVEIENSVTIPAGGCDFMMTRPGLPKPIPASDVFYIQKYKILLNQSKSRVETFGNIYSHNEGKLVPFTKIDAQNNSVSTSYDSSNSEERRGVVRKLKYNTGCEMTFWFIMAFLRGADRDFMNKADLSEFTDSQSAPDGNYVLICPRTEIIGEIRITVDPSRNFMPIQYEQYTRKGDLAAQCTLLESRNLQSIGIFPHAWRSVFLINGKIVKQSISKVLFASTDIITDDSFYKLTFPPGTSVYDETADDPNRRRFIVLDDGTSKTITDRDLLKTNAVLLAEFTSSSNAVFHSDYRMALAILIMTSIAFSCCILLKRRWSDQTLKTGGRH